MADHPRDNTGRDPATGRWLPGNAGNPAGRPRGARTRAAVAVETLLDGDAERLTQKAIALALEGDTTALKLCLERICPPSKGRPVKIDLPPVETASDLVQAMGAVVTAMAEGEILPDEAATVAGVLEAKRRAVETVDLERRIAALESERETT